MPSTYLQNGILKGRSQNIFDVLITIFFFTYFLIQLIHHQLWRDELNAWGLAVNSPTLSALINNVHVEGHPILWYLLLWIPARVTADPITLKVVQGLVGTGIYLILGLYSPFSKLEKIMIFSGYFVIFEYTVLTRMYGVCLLILLIYLYRRTTAPKNTAELSLYLGLLAVSDLIGLMLSCALLLEYAWAGIRSPVQFRTPIRKILPAVLIYFLFVVVSVWTGLPSKEVSRVASRPFGYYADDLTHLAVAVINAVVIPWLPIQHGFLNHYWGFIDTQLQLFVLVPCILFGYYIVFRKHSGLLILLGSTVCASIAFNHLVYSGLQRHLGITFLAFLACLWMKRDRTAAVCPVGRFFLGVTAISGIAIALLVWTRPFSNAGATADWLRSHHLDRAPLAGSFDSSVASIGEELVRPVYFLDCDCEDTFLRFSKRRDEFRWQQVPDRLVLAKQKLNAKELIFISSLPLSEEEIARIEQHHLRLAKLAEFSGAGVYDEDYFLYTVTTS